MPFDYASKQTDKELAKLERKLSLIYAESKIDLDQAVDRYYNGWDEEAWDPKKNEFKTVHHAGMKERYEKEYQAFLDGAYHDPDGRYTDEEMFNRYVWAQEGRGNYIKKMRDDMAKKMTETNQRAAAMINDTTPGIYSLNANWEAYKIEVKRKNDSGELETVSSKKPLNGASADIAFDIVNEQTIKELAQDKNHVEFRVNKVNPVRDYEWNKDQITKALTAGILQGDSVYDIANRFLSVMQRNRTAAIRNARTSITSAQNAGCQRTYERAEEMGIKLKKQWLSTKDKRTRDSHIKLNGETVPVNKKFSNGLMYPGDVDGAPAEVYNCRCTMVTVDEDEPGYNRNGPTVKGFAAWLKNKQEDNEWARFTEAKPVPATKKVFSDIRKHFKKKYGIMVDKGIQKLDYQTVKTVLDELEIAIADYPEILDSLTNINRCYHGAPRNGIMFTDGRSLSFNDFFFTNLEDLQTYIAGKAKDKDVTPNATLQSAVHHECGHIFERLCAMANPMYYDGTQKDAAWLHNVEAYNIVEEAFLNIKNTDFGKNKKIDELLVSISGVSKDRAEAIGEAFADCVSNGDSANPFSIEIKKVAIERYKYLKEL